MKDLHPIGFYTAEIREKGARKGFKLESFDGMESILSHTNIATSQRVGKYGVDVERFEYFLDAIPFLYTNTKVY